ncbi:MAG: hypothetical protein HY391_00180, partial [Deltaproteobacteria bacterium]|nr:hypothetical protein [Deltaproteobacteria bacterium]
MKKIETCWHYLLYEALVQRKFKHTQQELAEKLHYSSSTIHHALRVPAQIGAVRKASKFFVVEDVEKLLYYWASLRNLERDILYKTLVHAPIREMEGLVPPSCIFACYTAAKTMLGEAPADYSKVYFYAQRETLEEVKNRFPPFEKKKNIPPN